MTNISQQIARHLEALESKEVLKAAILDWLHGSDESLENFQKALENRDCNISESASGPSRRVISA